MYKVKKSSKRVKYILNHLRSEDEKECIASFGKDWKQKEFNEIMKTDFEVLVGEHDNKPVVMGGCWATDKSAEDVGVVWLLSTSEVSKYKVALLRHLIKEFKNEIDKKYWLTFNYVSNENKLAHKWLKGIGYKIENLPNIPKREGFTFFYRFRPMKGLN